MRSKDETAVQALADGIDVIEAGLVQGGHTPVAIVLISQTSEAFYTAAANLDLSQAAEPEQAAQQLGRMLGHSLAAMFEATVAQDILHAALEQVAGRFAEGAVTLQ